MRDSAVRTTIYALTDEHDEVRYIGKTSMSPERRLVAHVSQARRAGRGHKSRWIRAMLRRGESPRLLELIVVDGDGCQDERIIIFAFRAAGVRLTNATDGGEGRVGARRTEAEKAFLSAFHKGRKITWGDKISAAKRGKKFSAAHRAALSAAQRGKPRPWFNSKQLSIEHYVKLQVAKRRWFAANGGPPWLDMPL